MPAMISGNSIFMAAVRRGTRWNAWNTKPIFSLRTLACCSSFKSVTFPPSSLYVPELGRSSRPIKLSKVDLPEPDGPMTVSYTHLRAHETRHDLVCRLLLEKKKVHSPSR